MIDYTEMPLGLEIIREQESDRFIVHNKFDKNIEVTITVKPRYYLTLPFGMLAEDKESKIKVKISDV